MSTSLDFVAYVCEQIKGSGLVTYRKMFGEYMVYVNAKPILLVCDDTVYVKMLDGLKDVMKNAEVGFPYAGAKQHYILDIEDINLSTKVIRILEPLTSLPKPRMKKA
jgi:TfoX/Sxy family transcriptional regulator of competence genes